MSFNDLLDVFDGLDAQQRGFVTPKEIHQFYSSLFESSVNEELVDTVVENVCGHNVMKVPRNAFIDVLEEIQRRCTVEDEAYWDFQALDSNGNNYISLSHALLLFREYHGDLFSLDHWKKFLESREKPDGDVYFDELRSWLSEPPCDCRPNTQSEIVHEESRLEHVQAEAEYRELKDADSLMDTKDLERREEEERQEHIERSVKRKLHKWNTHGLAAMLEDHDGLGPDGDMRDDSLTTTGKNSIKTSDILALLEAKYSMLQDRVLMELASRVASIDSEKVEIFNSLKKMVSKPQKSRLQDEELSQLLEETSLPFTLLGMLGDLADAESGRRQEFEAMRAELLGQGKTEMEIVNHLRSAYDQIVQGEQTCDVALAQLNLRLKTERQAIMSSLHSCQSQAESLSSTQVLTLHYCCLLRQIRLLQGEDHMTAAGLAVGLAERRQVFKPTRYNWDRDRSEQLARVRLEVRVGRRQVKRSTTNIDLDTLEKAGSVVLRTRLIEEVEQAQYLEREAMVQFLQGSEAKSYLDTAASLSSEARQKQIRTLRSRRQECLALSNWAVNQTLLAEAAALYREERREDIEQTSPNVGEATVAAVVLADLQQRQEVEAERILQESLKQNERELTKAVLGQIEARQDQVFPNIAFVTLGGLEISAGDQEFLITLEAKFKAMRDQVFVFGLIERLGSSWRSMSKEEKQREISQQRKEEKRLRGEGRLEEMAQLIGPRSQALPSLFNLIGEGKTFPNTQPLSTEPDKNVNLLADLVSRFDIEQEALLSWLQLPEVKSLPSKVKHVQLSRLAAEKYVAGAEASHEIALLAVGLMERMEISRSKDDQEKQLTLAEKRFTVRKKADLNNEKLRSPPEEKLAPKKDNIRELQAVLVRAMLRRHYQERDVMLSVLQDQGFDELVEAAAVMPPEQALRRLKELQTKREGLNLDDKTDLEEQMYIFEEAGAIRATQKVSMLSQDFGRTVLLGEACTHLLAELQDLQDIELSQLFSQLGIMSASDITSKTDEEVRARNHGYCNNVMKVLTKFGGKSDQNIDKLVEQKYRHLLNLLVEESLCQQHGGKHAWDKMSQKQKVKAISALSAKAIEIWDTDNQATLSSWMDPKFQLQPSFPFLAGSDRSSYQEAVDSAVPGNVILEGGGVEVETTGGPDTVTDLRRRYKLEAGYIRNYLEGFLDVVPSDDDKQLVHNKLTWEITMLASAKDFASATLIMGLAERQTVDMNGRLEHDISRYQMLAENLTSAKLSEPAVEGKKADQIDDITELQALLLRTLHHKHVDEWMMMLTLLSSNSFTTLQETLTVETEMQRENRITQLHRQRDELDLKDKSKQLKILEEALTVRKESVRQTLMLLAASRDQPEGGVTEEDVHVRFMSQLLQFQLVEAQVHLEAFVVEDESDLRENHASIITEISQGHVSNVALVAFSGLSSGSLLPEADKGENLYNVEITQAVDGKYDALRDQLLIQALIDQMGEAEWNRLSDLERQRLLMELKLKERRLRREGKYDEAAALLGELRNNDENIKKLLGDAKADHERKLRERLERRKARLAQGMSEEECDDLEAEEIAAEEEEERQKRKNILLYLDQCSEQEKADLMKRLGDLNDDHEKARQRHMELLRHRREERRLRQEGTLDAASLLMGIAQDQHDKSNLSKEEEKRRQQELAHQRLELVRQRRQLQGDNLVRGETILGLDEIGGDTEDGRADDLVLGLLDVRHARERNMLIKLLDDHSASESRDEARVMTDDEIKAKLEEHQELFNIWRDSESRIPSYGEKILADSIGFCLEWQRRELERGGDLPSDEDAKVSLLAELQEVQEAEAGQTMLMLIDVDEERAEEIVKGQQQRLTKLGHDNLASVLLELHSAERSEKDEGEREEDEMEEGEKTVVQALEKKYDAMRDKLLMEALIREMGEADWSRLSDLERQRKLVELKMRERRLRREGHLDELAQLLGNFAEDTDKLSKFLGESAEDQRRRLQEKLALRKRLKAEREAQGETVDEKELDELVDEEDKKIQAVNILNNLDKQFEAEKAALLSALRNQPDHLAREKKRQFELAKFQREQRQLKKEDKLDSAAMIFALGEQNHKAQKQSVMSERDRQRELARQRLETLRQKKAEKLKGHNQGDVKDREEAEEEGSPMNVTDESTALQSNVLSGVEKLQEDERSMLMDLISKLNTSGKAKEMGSMSNNELQQAMSALQEQHQAWEAKTTKIIATQAKLAKLPTYDKAKFQKDAEKRCEEQADILGKALAIKFELECRRLSNLKPDSSPAQIKEELAVCALTALQEKQEKILSSTQDHITEVSVEDLKQSKQQYQLAHQAGVYSALSATCLSVCQASDLADLMKSEGETLTGDESHDMEVLLTEEYNMEKEELLQRGEKESINVDAALKRLGDQYKQRKQALKTDLARQQADLKERAASRRQAADDIAWDRTLKAGQIFATGSANNDAAKQAKKAELRRQDTLLQERLQKRRATKEAEKARKAAETEALEAEASDRVATPSVDQRFSVPALKREKTVVDVTEDEKQAKYDQLLQQERYKHDQITAAQARQEMILKKRREDRSTRRENEVAALFSLGERQKTSLEEAKKGERERQLAQVQGRRTRMRESRSQSPAKRASDPSISGFKG